MSTSKNKDNNKSKQNYPNYQMQVMLHVEASTLFIQQQVLCIFTMFIPASFSYY
jgi:hypothetical protein